MAIDTSDFKFPKPVKKTKGKGKGKGKKKKAEKPDFAGMFESEVTQMVDFYEAHRGDMVSIENYRHTSKLKAQAAKWILDVMRTQKVDDVAMVVAAWQQTIIHAAEKSHPSHKVGSFMNFWWIIKNDYNFLEILDGKYDKEFKNRNAARSQGIGWGSPGDFDGIKDGGASGTVV